MKSLITNNLTNSVKDQLKMYATNSDRVDVAAAFFSDSELIRQWDIENKKVRLLVSLRPPTSFHALKDLQSAINIEVSFLGLNFHSKFILFYNQNKLVGAVLGSSNYTVGGLVKNIETNLFTDDKSILSEIQLHYEELVEESHSLQPTDLDDYEIIYENWLSRQKKERNEFDICQLKISKNRTKGKQKFKVSKEASQYRDYWGIVDEIKGLVRDLIDKEYPGIPHYLALDHFWHYIKIYWHKESGRTLNSSNQRREIPKLFFKYIKWIKEVEEEGYLNKITTRSKEVFQLYLSEKNIDNLTKTQAKEIFQNLHSSAMPIQRFGADDLFISENSIQQIRKSFKYLIFSEDEMDLKIHNMIINPKYKLQRFGPSGVQELNGWTKPMTYPIRNAKATRAVEILGYNLEKRNSREVAA